MIAAEIIDQVLDAGGQIAVDGADLVLTAPRPLPADLLDTLKAHKPDIMKALRRPAGAQGAQGARRIYGKRTGAWGATVAGLHDGAADQGNESRRQPSHAR